MKTPKQITATEWGGAYLESIKKVAERQSEVSIQWLVVAGAINALPLLHANRPHGGIDLVAGYEASFQEIAREGFAEPVTAEKVPNLRDVPQRLLIRDEAGNVVNIPRTLTALFWFYRRDITPFEIRTLDDFLDPRLKGKICFPALTINSCLQLVSIALYKGGNEKNMEPAWAFMKRLARSGNIGRVGRSINEIHRSLQSGETSITFEAGNCAVELARDHEMRLLMKRGDPAATGFWAFLLHQGWSVIKGGQTDAAFAFVNFAIGPEINAEFNALAAGLPANRHAQVAPEAEPLRFSDEDIERYAYVPDWAFVTRQTEAWIQRWNEEIEPLL
jgi:putative spermidine/putrescine transport system substrate-binding protein